MLLLHHIRSKDFSPLVFRQQERLMKSRSCYSYFIYYI